MSIEDSSTESAVAGGLVATNPPSDQAGGRAKGIFGALVSGDHDIVGLVAYALYKQSKLDWMGAFEKGHGRAPNEVELNSYIVGEGTSRRLATYRHLAETALENWSAGRDGTSSDNASGSGPVYGKLFNYIAVGLALTLVVVGLTARMVFGHR